MTYFVLSPRVPKKHLHPMNKTLGLLGLGGFFFTCEWGLYSQITARYQKYYSPLMEWFRSKISGVSITPKLRIAACRVGRRRRKGRANFFLSSFFLS